MATKVRIILLGTLEVAIQGLEELLQHPLVDLLGVVCSDAPLSEWRKLHRERSMPEVARKLNVPLLSLDAACSLNPDLGFAIRFHQILRSEHLNSFKRGVVNLHGAPLPRYRGSMCDAAAILNNDSVFGASLHWMDTGVDSGPVITRKFFRIKEDWSVEDLFLETNKIGINLFSSQLTPILSGQADSVEQAILMKDEGVKPIICLAKDIISRKVIPSDATPEQIKRISRAFYFPGHEPAYFESAGKKQYIRAR